MAGYTELLIAVCAILLFIGLLYLIAFLAFAKKMRLIRQNASIKPQTGASQGSVELSRNKIVTMKQCPQCGKILVDEFGFCPRCGHDLV